MIFTAILATCILLQPPSQTPPTAKASRSKQIITLNTPSRTYKSTVFNCFKRDISPNTQLGYTAKPDKPGTMRFTFWFITPIRGDIDYILLEAWDCSIYDNPKIDSRVYFAKSITASCQGRVIKHQDNEFISLELNGIDGLGDFKSPQSFKLNNALN